MGEGGVTLPASLQDMFIPYVRSAVPVTSGKDWTGDGARLKRAADAMGGRCAYCQRQMLTDWTECHSDHGHRHPARMTWDHVVPRSRGGKNGGNRVPVCRACNHKKGNRMPTGCERLALVVLTAILPLPTDTSHDRVGG